ncbi:TrkH family potassium uptake protein [Celerinatantimonas yamalensis]|uniref:Trk system potassium uptake protein n=1 Tax=Celerinatantimonas yamalensis TaxID=559956 RepID=A0ABW9GBG3_9GAMM
MVKFKPIVFVNGLVLSKLALFMYVPAALAFFTGTPGSIQFIEAILITHVVSLLMLHFGRMSHSRMKAREMFLLTSSVWVICCAFGALPIMFLGHTSYTDAYFETMSGLTTTGSTILSGLDKLPPALLLWRSLLQWLGGIGFIVLAVAILPFLNVGGMRLFQTESSDWSEKSAPRTKHIAANILTVYTVLSILCAVGYRLAGMSWFEAINHAMTTLSTGGYSTSDQSMAHFSKLAHWNGILFMFLGGLPFLLFVQALRQRRLSQLTQDAQVRGFFLLIAGVTLIMSLWLWRHSALPYIDALRVSLFNILSIVTTTGFGLTDFSQWGHFTTTLFVFLMLVGACSGSTAGGLKIFRLQIAATLFHKQVRQLLYPRGIFPQRYNGRPVNDDIVRSVVAFTVAYGLTIIVLSAGLSYLGSDPTTAISGAITAVANVGPGLGEIIGPSSNFASLPDPSKWLLSGGMLMGRLEILTVVVLFFPAYWRDV